MCRHCERIFEHPEDRPIVHAFMELTAKRIREHTGHLHLRADDIDVTVDANLFAYSSPGDCMLHIKGTGAGTDKPYAEESARIRVLRMLTEMHK